MNQSKCNNFVQVTHISSATIDTILTQGANILYDHYIQTKIPKKVKATFEKIIENVFQPTLNNQNHIEHGINTIHESFRQKINIAGQRRKNETQSDSATRNKLAQYAKTIELDKHIARKIHIKAALSKKQKSAKRITKESSNCLQSLCSSFGQLQDNQEMLIKRKQRQQRFKHQFHEEQQMRERNQKNHILKKQLEQQLRQLQEHQKTITFNHQTGRVFQIADHHDYSNIKNNIINLRYGLNDQQSISNDKGIKQSFVMNSKKIINMQRGRKKFSFINQQTNDSDYNNHGKRQISVASFMDIQEGIKVYQGKDIDNINYQNNNRKSRINTASLTVRTFKSYTKEKMESSRFIRTKATASSGAKTTNINESKDQIKDENLMRSSVLWSSRGDSKNHRINKNPQLINNFFDISQQ